MAKRVIWSKIASEERIEILEFWIIKTQSKSYSKKLNILFNETIKLIRDFNEIGRLTDINNVRRFVIKDYLIFYKIEKDTVQILSIWDGRQNPEKLKDKF